MTTKEALQITEVSMHVRLSIQVLDFSNYQLVQTWLDLSCDSDGAIYFSEHNELMVLTRDSIC